MATYEDVLGAAQGLPPTDRIRLINALWETVPPEDWPAQARNGLPKCSDVRPTSIPARCPRLPGPKSAAGRGQGRAR